VLIQGKKFRVTNQIRLLIECNSRTNLSGNQFSCLLTVCTAYVMESVWSIPFFSSPTLHGCTAQFWALAASMKLSVSFRLLDLGQSAGLLGRVISSSQGLYVSAAGDCEDGEVGGMNGFGRGNRSTPKRLAPTPLCPPQISLVRPGQEPGPPQWEASD
jgi:hypothetical protein